MANRSLSDYSLLILKGIAMGIANKAGYKKREVHAFLVEVAEELFMANLPGNLKWN